MPDVSPPLPQHAELGTFDVAPDGIPQPAYDAFYHAVNPGRPYAGALRAFLAALTVEEIGVLRPDVAATIAADTLDAYVTGVRNQNPEATQVWLSAIENWAAALREGQR